MGLVNQIVSTHSSVPGLTQDDSLENYCDADNLPSAPDDDGLYSCTHMVSVPLGIVVDLIFHDGGRK